MAKAKKLKKAQKEAEMEAKGLTHKCASCGTGFTSKTKLFDHIKELGHAQVQAPKK